MHNLPVRSRFCGSTFSAVSIAAWLGCSAKANVDLGSTSQVSLRDAAADDSSAQTDGLAGGETSLSPEDAPSDDASDGSVDAEVAANEADGGVDEGAPPGAIDEAGSEGGCLVTVASPPLLPALHVAIGSDIQWDSNPPSSGPHFPIWAAYQAYDTPVPRGYYVHDLEHGAIVFVFNCGDAGCPDVVAAFHAASDSLPDDPLCTSAGEGIRVRTVITPDPLLDVTVAAAAWGWTYKGDCVDLPSLEAFAAAHYGQGPEQFCTNGTTQF